MKVWASLLVLASVAYALPVAAQQPDNAAILKAIQGLSGRMDGMQKQINRLEGQAHSQPLKSAVSDAGRPDQSRSKKTIAGWLVNVVPGDDESKDAIASLPGPMSKFDFSLHTKAVAGRNEYAYHGAAFFHPDQVGRYVFVINIQTTALRFAQFNCKASFSLNGKEITSGETNYRSTDILAETRSQEEIKSQSFSGGADLDAIDYKADLMINCHLDNRPGGEELGEKYFPIWQDNRVSIMVKGPDDEKARAFESNELFHVGKAKKP